MEDKLPSHPRPRPCRTGQTLIEFAMVLPVLITLIVAIFDFSYYFFIMGTIHSSMRFTVRRASMNNMTRTQIKQMVKDQAVGTAIPAKYQPVGSPTSVDSITITTKEHDDALPGSPPTVELVTQFDHPTWGLGIMGINTLPVKSNFKSIIVTYPSAETITF